MTPQILRGGLNIRCDVERIWAAIGNESRNIALYPEETIWS